MQKPAKPKAKAPLGEVPASFAPIVAAFARDPRVSRKRMFSSDAVLNYDGKIFAMLVKGRLVVKLPKARVDELVDRGQGKHFDPGHGRLMKEWLSVETAALPWVDLAREALAFAKGGKR
jgi:TfoX/Sxy family transcriptional regulator of competence genes